MASLDFDALKRKDAALRDEHLAACQEIFRRCQSTPSGPWHLSPQDWVEQFVTSALHVLRPAKVPLSPAMGQGLLESGFGHSMVLFGIKARQQDVDAGKAKEYPTRECIGGKWISTTAFFFVDASMSAQFVHYLDLVRRVHPKFAKFYPAGRNEDYPPWVPAALLYEQNEDYLAYILRPAKAYATDPEYKSEVLGVVRSVGLDIFDRFDMYGPA